MISIRLSKAVLILHSIYLFTACLENVSRDNPLDPANGNENLQLSGQVLTFYQPRKAIVQAAIQLQPGNLVMISNVNGTFQFNNLKPGEYALICNADKYRSDSITINLQSNFEHTFLLDGLPQIKEISIKAHHRSRWFPQEEIYFIELEAEANDPDGIGDIRSMVCEIPSMSFYDTLQAGIEAGRFSSTLFDSDLPVVSVHQLIGRQIYFVVEDDFETKISSDAKFLTRIIEQTPKLISPTELKSIESSTINFNWERVSVPYPATLKIEIFRINLGIAFKTDERENIPIDEDNLLYVQNLSTGDYYWTINIVDEFGNSSSSREGTFQIR